MNMNILYQISLRFVPLLQISQICVTKFEWGFFSLIHTFFIYKKNHKITEEEPGAGGQGDVVGGDT